MSTLLLLDEGVPPGEVYEACRISWGQVEAWRSKSGLARSEGAGRAEAEERGARVFTVVDDQGPSHHHRLKATADPKPAELELRLGPWSVSVRLASDAGGGS